MDAAHWQQSLGLVKPMEEMLMAANAGAAANTSQGSNPNLPAPAPSAVPGGGALRAGAPPAVAGAGGTERRARPQKEKALNCPRCNSTNTKFCYYNNYSLQQPRYFCKTCRRYWTEGGSLRNVPVGGGSRKNKRSSSSSSAPASTAAASVVTSSSMASTAGAASKNPKLAHHEGAHDLNLAFPHHGGLHAPEFAAFPSLESSNVCSSGGAMAGNGRGGGAGPAVGALSAMELLRSSGCYMPLQMPMQMPGDYAATGFALGEFRAPPPPPPPSQSVLGFSLDAHGPGPGSAAAGYGSGGAGLQGVPENAGRLLFPFEDLKPPVSSGGGGVGAGASGGAGDGNSGHPQFDHSKEQGGGGPGAGHDTPGFWNGMMGGSGASW